MKNIMLKRNSWSDTPDGVYPLCNSNSFKVARRTSDDTMASHCFKSSAVDSSGNHFGVDDDIMADRCIMEDSSVPQYPLNDISRAENELSFIDNDCEDKESNDLLDYGWLDIENFEDVDRMFRSCDSTFGLGSLNDEKELHWLSSPHATEGSGDALKPDFKISYTNTNPLKSLSDYKEDFKSHSSAPSINNTNEKRLLTDGKSSSGSMDVSLVELIGSGIKNGSTNDFKPKGQEKQKKQSNHQNRSEVRRKDDFLENGQQITQNLEPDSLRLMQANISFVHSDNHVSDNIPLCKISSGSRSEDNGYLIPSLKESSYSSNMESSHGHTLDTSAITVNEKRENLYSHDDTQAGSVRIKNENISSPISSRGPVSVKNENQSENETEVHSEVAGISIGFPQELGSSNIPHSSSMSSAPYEISLEATSFCQLQQVLDQLDIRTRLRIRDSLYRLARSAEQRHNHASMTNTNEGDNKACRGTMAQGTDREMMDMETNTNPIDRSIAYLLFHRPSEPSTLPDCDLYLSSRVPCLPVTVEKKVNIKEEACTRAESKSLAGIEKE